MIELKGYYNSCIVYNDNVEQSAISQIYSMLNCKAFEGEKIRIMSDVHAGSGCVIGFTSTYSTKLIPFLVGVDISCGVMGVNLGKLDHIDLEKLDTFVRNNIPWGHSIRQTPHAFLGLLNRDELYKVAKETNQNLNYVERSLASGGGGNHYQELSIDDNGNYWLTVHSGSRNFGLKIANFFQTLAKKNMAHSEGTMNGLEYLEGEAMEDYIHASEIAADFSHYSRLGMLTDVVEGFFKMKMNRLEKIESIHNYVDTKNKIIRKGAVAAYKDKDVIIPWNMRDGTIICKGKGNDAWNQSAPHGAGRVMGRGEAKRTLQIGDFEDSMKGIYSTCISMNTIDESPMAYKNPVDIMEYITDTVDIVLKMLPLWNFKASE
jgi:RNA-splicing ligase RtcB